MNLYKYQLGNAALLSVVLIGVYVGLCESTEESSCDQRNLEFSQNYYELNDNIGKAPRLALRGSNDIYYGQMGMDVIFNITAPSSAVVEVKKICVFTRNVYTVNVRSTIVYGVIDGEPITGSGVVDGNFPVEESRKWMKTCIKPKTPGKVNEVRIQFRIRVPNKRKIRVQKLLMTACRVLN